MNIVFLSNYFNHHQKPFSDEMFKLIGDGFNFIETIPMENERIRMGWNKIISPSYVLKTYKDADLCQKKIDSADIVILGSAPEALLRSRKKNKKIIVRYSERPLKNGFSIWKYIPWYISWHLQNPSSVPIYMLCASAYTADDYRKFKLFNNKTYKWGYFPELKVYNNIQNIIKAKKKNSILWAARFLDWKHPEFVVELALYLKRKRIPFEINMIGCGEYENKISQIITDSKLTNNVHLLGAMTPENVREYMEKSEIFISTSDRKEGWGAVINESMNSACAVVANKEIGSVPFLIQNGENGFVYSNKQEFCELIEQLLNNESLRIMASEKAYRTILESWNPQVAAKRLLALFESITSFGNCNLFANGPCSKC